jgi:hypothetical protein
MIFIASLLWITSKSTTKNGFITNLGTNESIDEVYLRQFDVNPQLNETHKMNLCSLLKRYRNVFAFDGDDIGCVRVVDHEIDTGDHPPVSQPPYRTSQREKEIIEKQVEELLAKGLIKPIQTSWAVPVVLVNGRNGKIRFCCDYRKVNAITKPDVYPIPRLDDGLTALSGNEWFSTMDVASMFW